jgi:MoaA/NifB/PqqE/SkfB family radical SAM enzyme
VRGRPAWTAVVDDAGRLVLPDEARHACGLIPGDTASVELDDGRLMLRRPATQFAKLYLEPTTRCNLACRMCVRNSWSEPIGDMSQAVFEGILEGLSGIEPTPRIVLAGFGEPLAHPRLAAMVAELKRLGAAVEIVTNGTLLTRELAANLLEAGLDKLWVSLDGAQPESYADARSGADLRAVLENLSALAELVRRSQAGRPEIGIVFVATRRNIDDLPSLVRLSTRLRASRFIITNVLPYSPDMCDEILYTWAMNEWPSRPTPWCPDVRLPSIDVNQDTREALMSVLRPGGNVRFLDHVQGQTHDRCAFIEQGAAAVGWDGSFSPCPTLLHDQVTYVQGRRRSSRRYVIGQVPSTALQALWGDTAHLAFRERVRAFDFSPCTLCGGCDLSEANEEDCFGNAFPTCGGCLWAQGVLQCP